MKAKTYEQWSIDQSKASTAWVRKLSPPLEVGAAWSEVKSDWAERDIKLRQSGYGNSPGPDDPKARSENYQLTRYLNLRVRISSRGTVLSYKIRQIRQFSEGDVADLEGEVTPRYWPAIQQLSRIAGTAMIPESREFDPVALVRVVNTLQAMGEDGSRAVIDEYMKLCMYDLSRAAYYGLSEDRLFYVLRLLYVRRDGQPNMPEIVQGSCGIPQPSEDDPTWPLVMENDLPFNVIAGQAVNVSGYVTQIEKHLDYVKKHCQLRPKPLVPASDPLTAVTRFTSSPRWKKLFTGKRVHEEVAAIALHTVRRQALRSLDRIYPVKLTKTVTWTVPAKGDMPARTMSAEGHAEIPDGEWKRHTQAVAKLKPVWLKKQNDFARALANQPGETGAAVTEPRSDQAGPPSRLAAVPSLRNVNFVAAPA